MITKPLTCIIIDDEPLAIELLEGYAKIVPFVHIEKSFVNAVEALGYLQSNKIDLLFLDINMPDLNGLQFSKAITSRSKPMIVFTTAYSEYASESYEHNAIDYLLKPIEFERFVLACNKALELYKLTKNRNQPSKENAVDEVLLIKNGTKITPLKTSEIQYIEGSGNYVTYHTSTKKVMSLQNMSDLEINLSNQLFCRIHKSFIIANAYITSIERHQIQLGKTTIPIGKTYRQAVHEKFGFI